MKSSTTLAEAQGTEKSVWPEAVLEVVDPSGGRRLIYASKFPFVMGRKADADLMLRDTRISRENTQIVFKDDGFYLEDLQSRHGTFVNEERVQSVGHLLKDGDCIDFGVPDSYRIIFHLNPEQSPIEKLLTRFQEFSDPDPRAHALHNLNMLLEATSLVQSRLPLKDILAAVVDRAIEVTGAHRGLLLEPCETGELKPVLARQRGARFLSPDEVRITSFVKAQIEQSLSQGKSVSGTINEAGEAVKAGYGQPRAGLVCACAPLFIPHQMLSQDPAQRDSAGAVLGLLYLDRPSGEGVCPMDPREFRQGKQILNTLAVQVASVMANARLVQSELEHRRIEQEHATARSIQQALLPNGLKNYPYLQVCGTNRPCFSVGGDYFDLLELGAKRAAFIIADVSGKGLGAALVTTMLQGTFSSLVLGSDPLNVFEHANRFVCGRTEVDRFATIFFGTLHSDGRLEYINAGHLPPILVSSGVVKPTFEAGSIPLGLIPDTEFVARFHQLDPGDTLVLYTDGVTDAMDSNENSFGVTHLQEVVSRYANAPVEDMQSAILNSVDEFTCGSEQVDDITVLIIRYAGRG